MNITQMRYFQVLAKAEHFTRAAQELNLTQSALSSTIKRMETELGFRLFQKDGRNVVLSSEGKVFLRYVEGILDEYDRALSEVRSITKNKENVLTIGTTSVQFHQNTIMAFLKSHPETIVRQHIVMTDNLTAQARDPDTDFIISSLPCMEPGILCVPLQTQSFSLAVSLDHPLASRSSLALDDVWDLNYISLPQGYAYRDQLDRLFAQSGHRYNVVVESYPEQFPYLVAQNMGAVFATEASMRSGMYTSSSKLIPFRNNEVRRTIYIIRDDNRKLSPCAEAFINELLDSNPNGGERRKILL